MKVHVQRLLRLGEETAEVCNKGIPHQLTFYLTLNQVFIDLPLCPT